MCISFFKKKHFTIRNITHKGQEIKKKSKEYTENFFKLIFNIRSEFSIIDNICQIGNMDESAIYYENIYPTTIANIGEKNVNVRTFGKDKMRISIVLTILVYGSKLPPF